MKMKEFGPGGARPWRPPLDPPMDTHTDLWRPLSISCVLYQELKIVFTEGSRTIKFNQYVHILKS